MQITGDKALVRVVAVVVGLSLALAACGASKEPAAKHTQAVDPVVSQVQVPSGVTLTKYGTVLKFGEPATVAYVANKDRKTVLELKVLSATQGSIADLAGYTLEERTRQSTPFYVRVYAKNVGVGDVGQTPIPLFLVDNRNTLISASSFTNSFAKCPSTPLPVTFAPNDDLTTCLVYLAPDHGTFNGVSYRAVQQFAPIVWNGALTVPTPAKKPSKKPAKKPGKAS